MVCSKIIHWGFVILPLVLPAGASYLRDAAKLSTGALCPQAEFWGVRAVVALEELLCLLVHAVDRGGEVKMTSAG